METIPSFFEKSCEQFPGNIYLWEKTGDQYTGTTYRETREQVHRFAAGLISLGIRPGDRIALISEGRNAWIIGELGILFAGAVNVPLSVKLSGADELKFRLNHSGARMVIASAGQAPKIRQIKNDLPCIETIILVDEQEGTGDGEMLFSLVQQAGRKFQDDFPEIFKSTWQSVMGDDVANICYTSGTTADPKGIMLTHGNYISNVRQGYSLMDIQEHYSTLLILPWDHAFAHTAGIYCFMGKGASIASVKWGTTPQESLRNIPGNILEIRPQIILSVPALADNFRKRIEKSIRAKGWFAEKLFGFALKISYLLNKEGWNRGEGASWMTIPLWKIFDLVLFRKIREGFGGRLEFFVGGGALLDIEFQRFFYAIGIPMFQGYGLTEASPVISSNSVLRHKLGSSGTVAASIGLQICNENGEALPALQQGEIVINGANVMKGYWQNQEATLAAIRDGWLWTGDLGYLDYKGFLYVLGRYKSLLIADDGEKYSPEGMEESFCGESEFIDQCMLYNNQDAYTVALVVPCREKIMDYLSRMGLSPSSDEGLVEALKKIDRELKEYLPGGKFADRFPRRWIPRAIGILPAPFTEENHLINSTLKMVRGKVTEQYRSCLDYLFTANGRDIQNHRNKKSLEVLLSL